MIHILVKLKISFISFFSTSALLVICLALASCAIDVGGYITPDSNLNKQANYYIFHSTRDERGLHELLRKNMEMRGYNVSSGSEDDLQENIDYVLRYGGQWQWDVTWYLLNLDIKIYHSETRLLAASAHSLRTSLVRRSSEGVVSETLDQIFDSQLNFIYRGEK